MDHRTHSALRPTLAATGAVAWVRPVCAAARFPALAWNAKNPPPSTGHGSRATDTLRMQPTHTLHHAAIQQPFPRSHHFLQTGRC